MEGKGGREVATEGRAGDGRGGQARAGAGLLFGSAAPRIRARHCRAKIGGAAGPATSRSPKPVVATSDLCRATMHGAAQAFDHARAIGAAKGVIFF